jgi:hypothetical protein
MQNLLNQLMQIAATTPDDAELGRKVRQLLGQNLNEGGQNGKQLLRG